jgi:hypothetical protein
MFGRIALRAEVERKLADGITERHAEPGATSFL